MSYCRWSECDVYAYDSCEGGVRFYVAGNDSLNRLCGTYNEAYQYAKRLRDEHGFDVPDHAINELREDAIDEAKQYLGPDSAVADILAENAKLRELVRDAWGGGHPDKSCGDCEIRDECHDDMERLSRDGVLRFSRCLFELRIENRMRELGIEVSE